MQFDTIYVFYMGVLEQIIYKIGRFVLIDVPFYLLPNESIFFGTGTLIGVYACAFMAIMEGIKLLIWHAISPELKNKIQIIKNFNPLINMLMDALIIIIAHLASIYFASMMLQIPFALLFSCMLMGSMVLASFLSIAVPFLVSNPAPEDPPLAPLDEGIPPWMMNLNRP